MPRKSRWSEKIDICNGIDMYLVERRGYTVRIRRYAWNNKKKKHIIGETLPIINNDILETLWNLRMAAFMETTNEHRQI